MSAGVLLPGIGIGHAGPGRSRTGDGQSAPPHPKRRCLPERRRVVIAVRKLLLPRNRRGSVPGKAVPIRAAVRRPDGSISAVCSGRLSARSRRRQPAAEIPPLSPQFPASDLKSPLHRGHRSVVRSASVFGSPWAWVSPRIGCRAVLMPGRRMTVRTHGSSSPSLSRERERAARSVHAAGFKVMK